MANNINREGFKRFLELGAPSFEGNIILDSGELSEYYSPCAGKAHSVRGGMKGALEILRNS